MATIRQAQVSAGLAGAPGLTWARPMHWEAEIELDTGSKPNKAKVSMANLSPASLKLLGAKGCLLQVQAGDGVPSLLFQGDVLTGEMKTKRQGADWITEITARDGGRAWLSAATYLGAYPPGTTYGAILGDLFRGLGVPLAMVGATFPSGQQCTAGWTYAGPPRLGIDQLVRSLGGQWWIDRGKGYVMGTAADYAVLGMVPLISATTGMIDAPEQGKGGIVKVKSLLIPALRPGMGFVLQSRFVSGAYRATKVQHKLSSECTIWETAITGGPP